MQFDISELTRRGVVIADGGTGTMLQARGLGSEGPEIWCLTHPEEIIRLHREYLEAGANVIMPNLSPAHVRGKYAIYDGKDTRGMEGLPGRIEALGLAVGAGRGDAVRL